MRLFRLALPAALLAAGICRPGLRARLPGRHSVRPEEAFAPWRSSPVRPASSTPGPTAEASSSRPTAARPGLRWLPPSATRRFRPSRSTLRSRRPSMPGPTATDSGRARTGERPGSGSCTAVRSPAGSRRRSTPSPSIRRNSKIVYAATDTGPNDGVHRSADGGATWTRNTAGLPHNFRINALAIDPKTPATLYVGLEQRRALQERGRRQDLGAFGRDAQEGDPAVARGRSLQPSGRSTPARSTTASSSPPTAARPGRSLRRPGR